MKAWELREKSGPRGLRLDGERPIPAPRSGEVLIRMRAASLNYHDLLVASGKYAASADPRLIPLSDGAGEIAALGEGVTDLAVGDRVVGGFFPKWISGRITAEATSRALGGSADGVLAEYVVLPATGVARFPAHLSFVEAACLPCAALPAWNALVEVAGAKPGQTVLVLGTGGVSIFALQFAKLFSARVIVTSSSDEKLACAKTLGADAVVNYQATPDWDDEVARLTDGEGVDVVVDVGGAGTLQRSIRSIRLGGIVAVIGVLTGVGSIDPRPIISKAARVNGVFVGSVAMFNDMNRAIARGGLHPVVDRVFAFEDAVAAYEHQAAGVHFGKVAIDIARE